MRYYKLTPEQFRTVPKCVWVTEWLRSEASRASDCAEQEAAVDNVGMWTESTHIIDGGRAGRRRHVRPNERNLFTLERPLM
jgi:hypothetical protein